MVLQGMIVRGSLSVVFTVKQSLSGAGSFSYGESGVYGAGVVLVCVSAMARWMAVLSQKVIGPLFAAISTWP